MRRVDSSRSEDVADREAAETRDRTGADGPMGVQGPSARKGWEREREPRRNETEREAERAKRADHRRERDHVAREKEGGRLGRKAAVGARDGESECGRGYGWLTGSGRPAQMPPKFGRSVRHEEVEELQKKEIHFQIFLDAGRAYDKGILISRRKRSWRCRTYGWRTCWPSSTSLPSRRRR